MDQFAGDITAMLEVALIGLGPERSPQVLTKAISLPPESQ